MTLLNAGIKFMFTRKKMLDLIILIGKGKCFFSGIAEGWIVLLSLPASYFHSTLQGMSIKIPKTNGLEFTACEMP